MATGWRDTSIDLEESESMNMTDVQKLFQDVFNEEKSTIEMEVIEGDGALPTISKKTRTKYQRAPTSSIHDAEQYSKKISKPSHVRADKSTPLPLRAYFVAGYQILLHLLLLYCVVGTTYLLCANENGAYKQQGTVLCDCTQPTSQPSVSVDSGSVGCSCANKQTDVPSSSHASMTPTKIYSEYPSINPTQGQSYDPTKGPSHFPTKRPSYFPTARPSNPEGAVVGDYKLSARNESHEGWLLCDGSYLNAEKYPKLFEVLGHSFGFFSEYPLLFALPDARDKVIGAMGTKHYFGEVIGNETITLDASQLPNHFHYIANSNRVGTSGSHSTTNLYLSQGYSEVNHNYGYSFRSTPSYPNKYQTSTSGSNAKISIVQPSVFLGNVFIYAGDL